MPQVKKPEPSLKERMKQRPKTRQDAIRNAAEQDPEQLAMLLRQILRGDGK